MRPIHVDAEQRSDAWFAARLGRLTGSRAGDMLAKIKTGEAAARRDLRLQLVCERLTGRLQEEPFSTAAMQRGVECEPLARAAYEALTGAMVRQTGFWQHPELMAGCSIDGDVDDLAGIVEIKCPKSATHLKYLRAGTIPTEHLAQITHNLWVTGAEWCDFVSWDDRFPPPLQLFVVRVTLLDIDPVAYEREARRFLADVDEEVAALTADPREAVA